MLVSTDCASAMANKPQTHTSTSKATVPISLRARMFMVSHQLRWRLLDYMVPIVSRKQASHDRSDDNSPISCRRAAALAAVRGRHDIPDAGGRRRDAADRIRAVDRGVEAGHRRVAADDGARLAR